MIPYGKAFGKSREKELPYSTTFALLCIALLHTSCHFNLFNCSVT